MDQKSFHFHEKKRVVVKIGSSSLNYEETGSLNFTKLEHLVRELCNLRNRGDGCLLSQFRCDRSWKTVAWHDRAATGTLYKTGMCSSRTGKTDDDLPEAVCRI